MTHDKNALTAKFTDTLNTWAARHSSPNSGVFTISGTEYSPKQLAAEVAQNTSAGQVLAEILDNAGAVGRTPQAVLQQFGPRGF